MTNKITKELRTMIENEVLHRYDNLEKAQDSANTLIDMIEKALKSQRKEIIEEIIKKRPFVDLTRDFRERNMIELYLDKWEIILNLIKEDE